MLLCLAGWIKHCHALQAVRGAVVVTTYPLLKYTGYGITFRKALVIVWAGLRGAVGLALSLFVLFDNQIQDRAFRLLAFFFMGLIAAITILVQGTTTGLLLQVCLLPPLHLPFLGSCCRSGPLRSPPSLPAASHTLVLPPPCSAPLLEGVHTLLSGLTSGAC